MQRLFKESKLSLRNNSNEASSFLVEVLVILPSSLLKNFMGGGGDFFKI